MRCSAVPRRSNNNMRVSLISFILLLRSPSLPYLTGSVVNTSASSSKLPALLSRRPHLRYPITSLIECIFLLYNASRCSLTLCRGWPAAPSWSCTSGAWFSAPAPPGHGSPGFLLQPPSRWSHNATASPTRPEPINTNQMVISFSHGGWWSELLIPLTWRYYSLPILVCNCC